MSGVTERFVWCLEQNLTLGETVSEVLDWPLVVQADLPECELAYVVGMHDGPLFERTAEATAPAARRLVHWVGTDAELLLSSGLLANAEHLAAPSVVDILVHKGVRATEAYLPTPPIGDTGDPAGPPTVACLVSGRDSRGERAVRSLQETLPDVRFDCFAEDTYPADRLGEVIERAWVSIQLDGHHAEHLSRMALQAGRPALVSYRLPYAVTVDPDHLLDVLVSLRGSLSVAGSGGLSEECRAFWRREDSPGRLRERLSDIGVLEEASSG